MPRYMVTIPVMTRIEEIHYVEANSEAEAVDMAYRRDPDDILEDNEYYELEKGYHRVEQTGK